MLAATIKLCNSNECLDSSKEGTFQEILVGVAPSSITDALYQSTYATPEHSVIGHQLLWALNSCHDIVATHLTQLTLEISRHRAMNQQSEARRLQDSKIANELKQRCSGLEHKLKDMERRNERLERLATDLKVRSPCTRVTP